MTRVKLLTAAAVLFASEQWKYTSVMVHLL
jgi:hypothetical protein